MTRAVLDTNVIVKRSEAILAALALLSDVIPAPRISRVVRDPEDDAFLACALEGRASFLVTGDADLLVIRKFREVRILTPPVFLSLLP